MLNKRNTRDVNDFVPPKNKKQKFRWIKDTCLDGLISLRESMLVLDIVYHCLRQHVSSKFRDR